MERRAAFGARVREYRELRGWTQRQLGEAVGVTPQGVSSWEKGRVEPPRVQVYRIEDALGVPGGLAPIFGYRRPASGMEARRMRRRPTPALEDVAGGAGPLSAELDRKVDSDELLTRLEALEAKAQALSTLDAIEAEVRQLRELLEERQREEAAGS